MTDLLKICIECGGRFERRFEESLATFAKRIYCSNKCVQTFLRRRQFRLKHPEEKDLSQ
jgi:hypothetical protein